MDIRNLSDEQRAKLLGMTVDQFQSLVGDDPAELVELFVDNAFAADTYQPPAAAKNNAKKVLRWKQEHGSAVKGMTPVGWARARQLASGKPISGETVRRMAAFNRHRKNAAVDPKFKSEPWRDAGYVAWLGWGGTTGIEWAIRTSAAMKNKSKAAESFKTGQMVKWGSSGGPAEGKIIRIVRDGKIKVPNSSFTITGTEDDPAALILLYRDGKPTDTRVGHKLSTLSKASLLEEYEEDDSDDLVELEGLYKDLKESTKIKHYWDRPITSKEDKVLYCGYHIHSQDNLYGLHAHYPGGPLTGGHIHNSQNPLGYHTHRYSNEELMEIMREQPNFMVELDGPHEHCKNAPDGKHKHSPENFGPDSLD